MTKVSVDCEFKWDGDDGGRQDSYDYFYPKRPYRTGDCGPRAVAIATNSDYDDIHKLLDYWKQDVYSEYGCKRCLDCDHGTPKEAVDRYLNANERAWKFVDAHDWRVRTGTPHMPIFRSMILGETDHFVAVTCDVKMRDGRPKIVYTYHDNWDSTKSKRRLQFLWYDSRLGYVDNVNMLHKCGIEVHDPDKVPYFTLK